MITERPDLHHAGDDSTDVVRSIESAPASAAGQPAAA
jgi:hypothetical protein